MFWRTAATGGSGGGEQVMTSADLSTYTHILYLDIAIDSVLRYRREDADRGRDWMSHDVLREWRDTEKRHLRRLCAEHGILFSLVSGSPDLALDDRVSALLKDFRCHTPESNLAAALAKMDEYLGPRKKHLDTVLLMDGDRTLTVMDTGRLFWELACPAHSREADDGRATAKDVFSGPLGYSYTAFRQVTLLYEELAASQKFDRLCDKVQSEVQIDPRFVKFLHQAAKEQHVGVVVVTSGLGGLWEKMVAQAGLSNTVKVIGGGRISDGYVVTADVKAALIDHLHAVYNVHVSAFGDSPLDLPMLMKADDAIVVVCPEDTRSKAMDVPLLNAINNGLRACQMPLPRFTDSKPRLDTLTLPVTHLTHTATAERFLARRVRGGRLIHATDRASSRLLMTSTRDAAVAGPALRDAHFRIGQYLGTELVTEIVGLEEYPILHVQGNQTTGYRLRNETHTTIVAILRGGEPMAFGVNAAFPSAMFVHAKTPQDIKAEHVRGRSNIILVDSVVNNGRTILEFLEHLTGLQCSYERVVVVAGVVQSGAVADTGPIGQALARDEKLSVVALRLSTNKFTGKGTTDTGNRLFNTTHLD